MRRHPYSDLGTDAASVESWQPRGRAKMFQVGNCRQPQTILAYFCRCGFKLPRRGENSTLALLRLHVLRWRSDPPLEHCAVILPVPFFFIHCSVVCDVLAHFFVGVLVKACKTARAREHTLKHRSFIQVHLNFKL